MQQKKCKDARSMRKCESNKILMKRGNRLQHMPKTVYLEIRSRKLGPIMNPNKTKNEI